MMCIVDRSILGPDAFISTNIIDGRQLFTRHSGSKLQVDNFLIIAKLILDRRVVCWGIHMEPHGPILHPLVPHVSVQARTGA